MTKLDARKCTQHLAEGVDRAAIVRVQTPMRTTEYLCEEHWEDYLKARLGDTFKFIKEEANA